jgi:uroporphyrinogen decarboxylase
VILKIKQGDVKKMSLSHRERIENAISLKEVDRLPFGIWMHCHNSDRFPRRLAEFTLQFQRDLDLDFVKFMPYGRFSTVEWGALFESAPGFFDAPSMVEPVIKNIEDWKTKVVPRKGSEGEYAVVLEAQRLVLEELPKDVPFIVTIFSPLTIASWLATESVVLEHLQEAPEEVERALSIIRDTTIDYVKTAVQMGADGVFFSSKMSHTDALSREDHLKYVINHDLEIFNEINPKTWFNIVHIHGDKTWREDIVTRYPVPVFNWHDRDDGPSMDEARKLTPDKCFWGGLSHLKTINDGNREDLKFQVQDTWNHNQGKGVILGPGCVINARTPRETLKYIAECVKNTKRS